MRTRLLALSICTALLAASSALGQTRAGGEFRVNSYTTGNQGGNNQRGPAIAADASGNVVAVWPSLDQDGSNWGVFGQRYNAAGMAQGAEFQVNSYTTSSQDSPVIAFDAKRGFVLVWRSFGQNMDGFDVFGRRFNGSGVPLGAEFLINTTITGAQFRPSVASDGAGNFIVVWTDQFLDGSYSGIFGQRFDRFGVRQGGEFRVNSYTTGEQQTPEVAVGANGSFLVVWRSDFQHGDGSGYGVFAQRFAASGLPLGGEFRVNTYTTSRQRVPAVASDASGRFVVVWASHQDADGSYGIFAQRYDVAALPLGGEFQVNSHTTGTQFFPSVASDANGDFVVAWQGQGPGAGFGVFGRRFSAGVPQGSDFLVNSYTLAIQSFVTPSVASDANGNFAVAWQSMGQDGSGYGVFGQRFGGLLPASLGADTSGNGVLEPAETAVVAPAWRNVNGLALSFTGQASSFSGPAGATYTLDDPLATYGTVANGATSSCSASADCYAVTVSPTGPRPSLHWDASVLERVQPVALGQTKNWTLHLGDSFTDVPRTSPYYRFVETVLHKQVTGGCAAATYCPVNTTTREQMTVFVLVSKEGAGYLPPACTTPIFADVPASSPFCRFIEELYRRGVVGGCATNPLRYCPSSSTTREQMSVFLLKTLEPSVMPPPCLTPPFNDVPTNSPFCPFIAELVRRGITGGCGGGNYCPTAEVTREQMAVFLTATFGLLLYGP